jgi:hypothetical protein
MNAANYPSTPISSFAAGGGNIFHVSPPTIELNPADHLKQLYANDINKFDQLTSTIRPQHESLSIAANSFRLSEYEKLKVSAEPTVTSGGSSKSKQHMHSSALSVSLHKTHRDSRVQFYIVSSN